MLKLDRVKENQKKYILEKGLFEANNINLETKIKVLSKYKEYYNNSKSEKSDKLAETIVLNNFTINKTSKFLWKDLNNYSVTPIIDLYTQFIELKMWLKIQYFSYGSYVETYKEIEKWSLEEGEYIVGVYYINDDMNPTNILFGSGFDRCLSDELKSSVILYTNYGNIADIVHYYRDMFFEVIEVINFKVGKILSTKMINIINKSISSGNRLVENVNKKTSKELYEFIKEVCDF